MYNVIIPHLKILVYEIDFKRNLYLKGADDHDQILGNGPPFA